MLGLSWRTAPLPLREQAAFTEGQALDFCRALADETGCQCMVLSTCNRCEVYLAHERPEALAAARAAYLRRLPAGDGGCLSVRTGRAGAEHLFRVAAGLDSMVPGEDQILGQVQRALTLARAAGTAGKELGRMVQFAVTAAKRVKSELAISAHPLSLCYIGVQTLEREFGVRGRSALVLGSGRMAALALEHLRAAGAASLTVCCRTEQRGRALAERFAGLRVLPFAQRGKAAAECELIVGATASPHTVFRPEHLPGDGQPRAFLDLAIPRDIDPALAGMPGVRLWDVDSLQAVSGANLDRRRALAAQGEALLAEELTAALDWLAASRVDEGIEALQHRCARAEADTLALLIEKLHLEGHDARLAQKLLHAGFRRLMREPILVLKSLDDPAAQAEYTRVVRELFKESETEEHSP